MVDSTNHRWVSQRNGNVVGFEGLNVLNKVDFIVGHWSNNVVDPFGPPACIARFMSKSGYNKVKGICKAEFLDVMTEVRKLASEGEERAAATMLDKTIGPSIVQEMQRMLGLSDDGDIPFGFRKSIQNSYANAGRVFEVKWAVPPSSL